MGKTRPAKNAARTGTANKKSKGPAQNSTNKGNDWLDSLVQKSVVGNHTTILSKEQRKRKREAKKAKRQQQKEQKAGAVTTKRAPSDDEKNNKPDASSSASVSRHRIKRISTSLETVRQNLYGSSGSAKHNIQLYNAITAAKTIATKKRKLNKSWSKDSIQPRPSDYSGIGLARQSLYIEFVDPSYFPKLEEEFREHIPGFFGKQRTKAMKKQTDGKMLWRQLQDRKSSGMSKKLKNMNPDERVQAMIDAGMI
ncbi:MAG: hypothetical protein SGILL_007106 [Bacillariaceae sp.]